MKAEKQKFSIQIVKDIFRNSLRLTKMIWNEKRGYIILLIFIFLISSTMPFLRSGSVALLINELVNVGGSGQASTNLLILIVFVVLANSVLPFVYSFRHYISKLFYFHISEKAEIEVIKKRGEIDVAVHENPEYNDLFNKISEGGIWRTTNFLDRQFFLLENIAEVIFASVILIISQWWIFLVILLSAVPELIAEVRYGGTVWNIHSTRAEIKRKYWEVQNHFFSTNSVIELKLFQNTKHFLSIVRDLFLTFQKEERANERKRLKNELISLIVGQFAFAFAIVWFILQVVDGNFEIGTFTFILASIGTFRNSLSGLFSNFAHQYEDGLFVNDLFKFLDIKPVIARPKKGILLKQNKTPSIEFKNVSFRYPGTKKYVLKNFSISIPSGEKVAIVGINGVGKTTFVKLLCRFYDPDTGEILINGHNLKEIDLDSWYSHLGVIFQDYARYRFLVHETIAFGRTSEKETFERVRRAAKSSESDKFIEEWEKKYEQMLGKEYSGGIEPSVGQWQKLALARTFYRNPNVLILDEPTSSVDAEAEAKIFEKLEALKDNKTVILISHRFSTVRRAEKIAVIENGEMSEHGTHVALLKKKGTYSHLFKIQAKGYK